MTEKNYENPIYGSKAFENETDGMRKGEIVFCPIRAYGDCPYCDQCNICHIANPLEECTDFQAFFDSEEEWWANLDTEMPKGFDQFESNP